MKKTIRFGVPLLPVRCPELFGKKREAKCGTGAGGHVLCSIILRLSMIDLSKERRFG